VVGVWVGGGGGGGEGGSPYCHVFRAHQPPLPEGDKTLVPPVGLW